MYLIECIHARIVMANPKLGWVIPKSINFVLNGLSLINTLKIILIC